MQPLPDSTSLLLSLATKLHPLIAALETDAPGGRGSPARPSATAPWDPAWERELPARIPQKVVVVHGEHDDAVPVAESERFFARLPHAHKKLWVVQGGDHRLNGPIEAILDLLETELP